MSNDYGNIISRYTRAQALEDGVLVDVSELAREAGFTVPTAITVELHSRLHPSQVEARYGQSYQGRLWDVLSVTAWRAVAANEKSNLYYQVILAEQGRRSDRLVRRTLQLRANIGPGDQGEPVLTIGFPADF